MAAAASSKPTPAASSDVAASSEAADIADVTVLRVHYTRPDGRCQGWQLHTWGAGIVHETSWDAGMLATGQISGSCFWDVEVRAGAMELGFIVHVDDDKSAGGDVITVNTTQQGEIWLVDGYAQPFMSREDAMLSRAGSLSTASVHWVASNLFLWRDAGKQLGDGVTVQLYSSGTAQLSIEASGVTGSDLALELKEVSADGAAAEAAFQKFPHLRGCKAFAFANEPTAEQKLRLITSQACVTATTGDEMTRVTGVQLAGMLDDEYAYDGPLGDSEGHVSVWAPTAQSVSLLVFDDVRAQASAEVPMSRQARGCWSVAKDAAWDKKCYLYRITVYHHSSQRLETLTVTDPYSRALTADGARSMFVDLDNDSTLMPDAWRVHDVPSIEHSVDMSVYELHVRDFSACDSSVPAHLRGKYPAFSQHATGGPTAGQQHLRQLSEAGLTHVHLLPSYDFGSVPERLEDQLEPALDLEQFAADGEEQQVEITRIASRDAYNWGYDPVHYGVPEGSYATDPDSPARVLEYRQMVQALHGMGLRVVQDVVYNHTFASGLDRYSVLDKVVPGYYHRRMENGDVCNSTCCNNTATEHCMAGRLMIDDLVHWATHYKIDGFRFDIMGHIMLETMREARAALDALTVEQHGVDGRAVYLYGEAWDFGEVACNQRGQNASQLNISGAGIGAFNDRYRDAALGGSPFGSPTLQGFVTGLHVDPNPERATEPAAASLECLHAYTDWLKLGMAGNLKDFKVTTADGSTKAGRELLYGQVPAGYCMQPAENVPYLGCHDNEALYDIMVLKANHEGSAAVCARLVQVSLGLLAVSQGAAFFHAGDDLLRSKSLDRDSYNSGDWFNKLLWDGSHNNFGVGLPPASKNVDTWPLKRSLLQQSSLRATPELIDETKAFMRAVLAVRYSSLLFRLRSADAVIKQVSFENQGPHQQPGALVMTLTSDDERCGGAKDERYTRLVVVVNARPAAVALPYPQGVQHLEVHPALVGLPHIANTSAADGEGVVKLSPRTFCVFAQPR